MAIEPEMLAMETIVPVYFAKEDDELLSIYEQTQAASTSQGSASAAEGQYFVKFGWASQDRLPPHPQCGPLRKMYWLVAFQLRTILRQRLKINIFLIIKK